MSLIGLCPISLHTQPGRFLWSASEKRTAAGELNAEGLTKVLKSLKDFDTGGLTPPLTIKENRFPSGPYSKVQSCERHIRAGVRLDRILLRAFRSQRKLDRESNESLTCLSCLTNSGKGFPYKKSTVQRGLRASAPSHSCSTARGLFCFYGFLGKPPAKNTFEQIYIANGIFNQPAAKRLSE